MNQAELDEKLIATKAGEIRVYNFDEVSREYLSSGIENLALGVGIPANSCIDAPLKNKDGMAVCRTEDLLSWEYVSDHRSETAYDITNGKPFILKQLGGYPTSTTPKKPGSQYDKWDGDNWILDLVAQHEADIASAEKFRRELLNEVEIMISDWRTELLLGEISDTDKAKLSAWMAYKSAVKVVDVSTAPEISWPKKPQ
ncbi:virus tail fiber assembly protein lambda gpK [Pantoea allii]|uniref:Virus tail fiber assembly protein lambda gpK n=1 Tax=Pantoea allii TaxID=574096 RepID=A0A2V2BP28_9GAMM|nr:tail fiber assembly protein [Pantoea allii]NQS87133.1 tail fiber assembly protein [Pantoea allii]PWK98435.1 virus tail fiber assembly protein lambda gpK [Pantoea allii]